MICILNCLTLDKMRSMKTHELVLDDLLHPKDVVDMLEEKNL